MENSSFETLRQGTLTTKGSDEGFTVKDSSKVVCGVVKTANVTVHVVAPS